MSRRATTIVSLFMALIAISAYALAAGPRAPGGIVESGPDGKSFKAGERITIDAVAAIPVTKPLPTKYKVYVVSIDQDGVVAASKVASDPSVAGDYAKLRATAVQLNAKEGTYKVLSLLTYTGDNGETVVAQGPPSIYTVTP